MKRRGLTQFSRLYLFWTLRITFFFLLGRWLPRLGPARPGSARRAPTRAMFPLGARNLGVSTGSRRCQASELISIDRISTAPISRNLWGPVSVSLSLLLFRAEAGSKIPPLDARCTDSVYQLEESTERNCWKVLERRKVGFVKGFEISFLTISFVLKTNDSPNQNLESLVSNFSDFRLDSLLEDARYPHLQSLLCWVRWWKRVFFFSAGTV